MGKRSVPVLLVAVLALFFAVPGGQAQKVVDRAMLGHYTNDITYVEKGKLSGCVAVLDGYDVLAVPVGSRDPDEAGDGSADDESGEGTEGPGWFKLFDCRGLGIAGSPNGIAYMDTEKQFVLNDDSQVDRLFICDEKGRSRGTRPIRYPGGWMPNHLEAIAYVPPTSPKFPDHLIMVTTQLGAPVETRLEVMRRDGQVVAEIVPDFPPGPDGFIGLGYMAPDRLLISRADNQIWVIDFDGKLVAGPVALTVGQYDIEGLQQLPDGRIVAADIYMGTLFFLDEGLNRLPGDDRDFSFGVGVSTFRGLTWDTDTNQHLIAHLAGSPGNDLRFISAVPPSLDASTRVVDLVAAGFPIPRAMTYLPDEHLMAVAHSRAPQAIALFDNSGALAEQIDLSAVGRPSALAYIPTTHEFAVALAGDPRTIHILARNGAPVRSIDMSPTGVQELVGLASFDPGSSSGARLIVLTWPNRMLMTDLDGNVIDAFNWREKLDLTWPAPVGVSAITTGPQAGAFAVIAGQKEIVVFRWK